MIVVYTVKGIFLTSLSAQLQASGIVPLDKEHKRTMASQDVEVLDLTLDDDVAAAEIEAKRIQVLKVKPPHNDIYHI